MDDIKKYKNTKGEVVEALQFDGYNGDEVAEWTGGQYLVENLDDGVLQYVRFRTFLGKVDAYPGDYVIKKKDYFFTYGPEVMGIMYPIVVEEKNE